jgi:hypothetical protein
MKFATLLLIFHKSTSMEKIKERLEILLLYVTLIVSLSAFKDELSKICLPLGYEKITAAEYLLYCIYAFSLCLYLYILEFTLSGTKIGKWAVWNWVTKIAFGILIIILLSPIIVALNIIIVFALNKISLRGTRIIDWLSAATSLIGAVFSAFASSAILKYRKRNQQEEIQEREVTELENASRLLNGGFFSLSILESFKALESYLAGELLNQDIRVIRGNMQDLINTSIQNNILQENEIGYLNDLRGMRNQAAHSSVEYTREDAESALNFVRGILRRRTGG